MELRYLPAAEIRFDESRPRRLSGYAVIWGARSVDLGGFVEQFAKGAFRSSLADPSTDVRALINHNQGQIIARQSAGTLILREDDIGLSFEIPEVPDTTYGNDLLTNVRNGNITGMSFGFNVAKDGAEYDRSQRPVLRTVKAAGLLEISPVTFPAYEASRVFNRSVDGLSLDPSHDPERAKLSHLIRKLALDEFEERSRAEKDLSSN